MKKLHSIFVDTDNGILSVNGREISGVTAFSIIFKNGEYGLKVTHDEFWESSAPRGKFLLDLYPSEIRKK